MVDLVVSSAYSTGLKLHVASTGSNGGGGSGTDVEIRNGASPNPGGGSRAGTSSGGADVRDWR